MRNAGVSRLGAVSDQGAPPRRTGSGQQPPRRHQPDQQPPKRQSVGSSPRDSAAQSSSSGRCLGGLVAPVPAAPPAAPPGGPALGVPDGAPADADGPAAPGGDPPALAGASYRREPFPHRDPNVSASPAPSRTSRAAASPPQDSADTAALSTAGPRRDRRTRQAGGGVRQAAAPGHLRADRGRGEQPGGDRPQPRPSKRQRHRRGGGDEEQGRVRRGQRGPACRQPRGGRQATRAGLPRRHGPRRHDQAQPRAGQPDEHRRGPAPENPGPAGPHRATSGGRIVPARATARSGADALFTDSSYSVAGTESATIPAPACTYAVAVDDHRGADRDRHVEVAVHVEVADDAAVHPAPRRLQRVDQLHRPRLRRPGQGAGGEGGGEDVVGALVRLQRARRPSTPGA